MRMNGFDEHVGKVGMRLLELKGEYLSQQHEICDTCMNVMDGWGWMILWKHWELDTWWELDLCAESVYILFFFMSYLYWLFTKISSDDDK